MYRFAIDYLKEWKNKGSRKPLVIRGARQVGKSCLVRIFAESEFKQLVEINFEKEPDVVSLFSSNNPQKIVQLLELKMGKSITAGETILFLDEIQAAPKVLGTLRYFYEQLPELHVICAGSLLEFVLEDYAYSMPVGRIEYLNLGPMQFEEFLLAIGEDKLYSFLKNYSPSEVIPEPIHKKFMDFIYLFSAIGGMPEAVLTYVKTQSFKETDIVKHSITSTYRDDFNKYKTRVKHRTLELLFAKIPASVCSKFKYVNVDREEKSATLARALDVLCKSRVVYKVKHSSSGIPLGANVKENIFKILFLDVGLLATSLGLSLLDYEKAEDLMLVNSGAVCEQFVGQHLLYSRQFYMEPELYYWVREKQNSSAEVDYVISEGRKIIPLEVKAGKTGTLKSLHLFIKEKGLNFGVRINTNVPSILNVSPIGDSNAKPYKLLSLPIYLIGQVRRLSSTF